MLNVWMKIAHVVGFTTWVAGILVVWAVVSLVRGVDASSRPGVLSAGRAMAMLMDFGGLVAILTGAHLAAATGAFSRPWMHVKLTIVVVGILVSHIVLRRSIRRLRKGGNDAVPRAIAAVVLLSTTLIAVLALHPTLLR